MEKTTIPENLDDLLINEIHYLYSSKEQMISLFPRLLQTIGDRQLRKKIASLLEDLQKQKGRLEQISVKFNMELEGYTCKSMEGLVMEANDILSIDTTPDITDAALLATIQRMYGLLSVGYGTVCNYAYILGYEEVGFMLHDTLKEVLEAQEILNEMATEKINERAL